MLHLPGLVLDEQINPSFNRSTNSAWPVRGLYGEGTRGARHVFSGLEPDDAGESETVIVERLEKVLSQIIEHEENARQTLMEKKAKVVFNHIGRAYGILANAHLISSKETMNQLSFLRWAWIWAFSGYRPRARGRTVPRHSASASPKANFRQALRRGARPDPRGHGARPA